MLKSGQGDFLFTASSAAISLCYKLDELQEERLSLSCHLGREALKLCFLASLGCRVAAQKDSLLGASLETFHAHQEDALSGLHRTASGHTLVP